LAGVSANNTSLSKIAAHGAFYTKVDPGMVLEVLLELAAQRAKAHPVPYAHWYIDGGKEVAHDPSLTSVSYAALEPLATSCWRKYRNRAILGMGPENLRTRWLRCGRPTSARPNGRSSAVAFDLKVLTEGSGTQIFSTTFAQWAAREALRRAQPLTLVVRFASRQRQRR